MIKFLLCVAGLLAAGSAVAAPLLGSTVRYQYYYPDLDTPYAAADNGSYVVGAGVEVSNFADFSGTLDITASQIIIDFQGRGVLEEDVIFEGATFNGFTIEDLLGTIDAFSSFSIASTNMAGLDASRLSFTADILSVNFQGLGFGRDTFVILDIGTDPAAAPEPTSLALAGAALLGLVARRRRRD